QVYTAHALERGDTRHLVLRGCSKPRAMRASVHTQPVQKGLVYRPCHHLLYSDGDLVRLYPVNPKPTRNQAMKMARRLRVHYKFALDMRGLISCPYSQLRSPKMQTRSWDDLLCIAYPRNLKHD